MKPQKSGFGFYLCICFLVSIWFVGPMVAALAVFVGWWVIPVAIVVAYYIFKAIYNIF